MLKMNNSIKISPSIQNILQKISHSTWEKNIIYTSTQ